MPASTPPAAENAEGDRRHVHVRLSDSRASVLDLVTEYLQAAGKAPDWYWRIAGRLEEENSDEVEDLITSAFEAGAFLSHEHPEELRFDWVSEEDCEREKKAEERGQQKEERGKDRTSMSHYA
ncbi:MAG: hypothetical protein L3K04_06245 [Thermoplasmata archaeon]|nr:hypothetical protein [Thermoplasmata archaeon]MCI4341995.1 hypothetical protein [Thermoplasmata archaeon]